MPRDYYTGSHRYYLDKIAEDYRNGWISFGCIPAPGWRDGNGYGRVQVRTEGGMYRSHNYTLRKAVGPHPPGRTHAAHACRGKGCVNPAHLSWKSAKGNADDRSRDGTQPAGEANGRAKLSDDDVLEIHRLYATGGWSHRKLGERYGLSHRRIGRILSGEAWAHLHPDA